MRAPAFAITVVVASAATGCLRKPDRPGDPDADPLAPDALPATCATPGEVACDGRTLRTCGANGVWDPALDVTCDFTCSEAACVLASNVPAADVARCSPEAPALRPTGTVRFADTVDGPSLVCDPDCGTAGQTTIIASRRTQPSAPDLAWFCLSSVDLAATIVLANDDLLPLPYAVAFIVDGDATIRGAIDIGGLASGGILGAPGGPGGYAGAARPSASSGNMGEGPCAGGGGIESSGAGGGGGGGHESSGGGGGRGLGPSGLEGPGGSAGGTCGSATLIPLAGGSGGGSGANPPVAGCCAGAGGGGGGALQISARGRITIAPGAALAANGGDGYYVPGGNAAGAGGGGAGGAFLIEAPTVSIETRIDVNGGDGGASIGGSPGTGAQGTMSASFGGGAGVNGTGGGGGGGGGGRVRINATVGQVCPQLSPVAACSLGPLVPAE